jgi:hypothetical protein
MKAGGLRTLRSDQDAKNILVQHDDNLMNQSMKKVNRAHSTLANLAPPIINGVFNPEAARPSK